MGELRDVDGPFLRGLVGALALHALVIAGGYAWIHPSTVVAPSSVATQKAVHDDGIEIEWNEAIDVVVQPTAPEVTGSPTVRPAGTQRKMGSASVPSSDVTSPSDGRSDAGYALSPLAREHAPEELNIDLGIHPGQWSRWIAPSASATEAASQKASQSLREAFEAHDREVGIGPSGAIVSAFRDATRSNGSPELGTATFTVTVLRSGEVSVELANSSTDRAAWSTVGDGVAAALRRKPPRISEGRNGVRLVLRIVADERWANGTLARSQAPAIESETPPLRNTADARQELKRRNPAAAPPPGAPAEQLPLVANTQPTGVFASGRGKVGSFRLGIGAPPTIPGNAEGNALRIGPMLTGDCDPSNAAGRATRVVSTQIVSEAFL